MPEKCPHCEKEFANTKALGSHIHYMHDDIYSKEDRSEEDKERFQILLGSCLSGSGLRRPRKVDKLERAIKEIPEGVSPDLDRYRDPYRCAIVKEKLLQEILEDLIKDVPNEDKV